MGQSKKIAALIALSSLVACDATNHPGAAKVKPSAKSDRTWDGPWIEVPPNDNDGTQKPDPGGGGGGPVIDQKPGPNAIVASKVDHYLTDGPTADYTLDLSKLDVAVIQKQGSDYVTLKGVGTVAAGIAFVDDVPVSPYFLKWGKTYVYTSNRTLDMSSYYLGRPDGPLPEKSTLLSFNISNLKSFGGGDFFQLFSSNVGTTVFLPNTETTSIPADGDTAISGMKFDCFSERDCYLMDSTKGDRVLLTQLSEISIDAAAITRIYRNNTIVQVDGTEATLGGAFEDVPPTSTLSLNFRRSAFSAQKTLVNPKATLYYNVANLAAHPGAQYGIEGYALRLVNAYAAKNESDLAITAPYSNPTAWDLAITAQGIFVVSYTATGATTAARGFGYVQSRYPVDSFVPDATPVITPPLAVVIGGKDASVEQAGIALNATIAWKAPTLGRPNGYRVSIVKLSSNAGQSILETAATIYTKNLSVAIPPGVLAPGTQYFAVVRALDLPGIDITRTPFHRPSRSAWADALTAAFGTAP